MTNCKKRGDNIISILDSFTIIGLGLGDSYFSETPISVIARYTLTQPYFILTGILVYILTNANFVQKGVFYRRT